MQRPEFLRALWPDDIGSEERLVVWSPAWKAESPWCTSLANVDKLCRDDLDIYFAVCMQHASAWQRGARGKAITTSSSPGLWVDYDVGDKDNGKKYPPDSAALDKLIKKIPVPATIEVESGSGGLHLYWLWKEPWHFDSGKERDRCATLSCHWQELLRRQLRRRKFDLDSTHDLARVLRMPGTKHGKTGAIVRVREYRPEARYNPSDFDDLVGGIEVQNFQTPHQIERRKQEVHDADLSLTDDAMGPPAKLQALLQIDQDFTRTWERRRTDFPKGHESQSEYDLSIATRVLTAGFTWQEAANTIIQHRREGGGAPKLRLKYVRDTLARADSRVKGEPTGPQGPLVGAAPGPVGDEGAPVARPFAPAESAAKRYEVPLDDALAIVGGPGPGTFHVEQVNGGMLIRHKPTPQVGDAQEVDGGDATFDPGSFGDPQVDYDPPPATNVVHSPADDMRAQFLETVRNATGLAIRRILKYPGEPEPQYVIMLDDERRILIGAAQALMSQTGFRTAVVNAIDALPNKQKTAAWEQLVRAMLRLVEVQDVGTQASPMEEAREWLERYIRDRIPFASRDLAMLDGTPFEHTLDTVSYVAISLGSFRRWLLVTEGERISSIALGRRLRACGFTTGKVHHFDADGGARKTACWFTFKVAAFGNATIAARSGQAVAPTKKGPP